MGFFRTMFDLVRGVSNDVADKMTDPARQARLMQEDLRSVDKNAINALTTATEARFIAEKEFKICEGEYQKYEKYAKKAAAKGDADLARQALVKLQEIKPDYERSKATFEDAKRNQEEMKTRFETMEKQRQTNFQRAKRMESRAQMNKTQKDVAKLMDKNGMVDGSSASKLDKLERKVEKEEIRNAAQQRVAIGLSVQEDDAFKQLDDDVADLDIEAQLQALMQTGEITEKSPVSIEEKQSSPLTQHHVGDVHEAVPVEKTGLDKELEELKTQHKSN